MTEVPIIEKRQLGELKLLSDGGGQAIVFEFGLGVRTTTGQAARLVYKEYRESIEDPVNEHALRELIVFRNSLSGVARTRLIATTALPIHLVREGKNFVGFTMARAPQTFYRSLRFGKIAEITLAEVQYLLNSDVYTTARDLVVPDELRLKILSDTASSIAFFHQHDLVVGDLSAKNLLFRVDGEPKCFFLDSDAMRLRGLSALKQAESTLR